MTSDSDSDYVVEENLRPDKVTKRPVNDDSADLLGNFDDAKRKQICDPSIYETNSDAEENMEFTENNEQSEEAASDLNENSSDSEGTPHEISTHLSKNQVEILRKGASKQNRYVLYVTNLNFETTKEDLENFFQRVGEVKGVRIPRKRRGGFAFVEMSTFEGFQKAFEFHNQELQGRNIKIQFSEGGKKKSANKKNILKQKNRKLAEMRNETKCFGKSGKNYDKNIKKEKAKELQAKKRWRKKQPAPK